jgi:hypothetical protein
MGISQARRRAPPPILGVLLLALSSAFFGPASVHAAGITVAVDWDAYAAPAGAGNVTANVISYFRRVYSQFTSIRLVTNGTGMINVTVFGDVKSDATGVTFGWSPVGTGPAEVHGGGINSVLASGGFTNATQIGNAMGHTLAHEIGHALGLPHNHTTTMLMCDGGLLSIPRRASGLQDGFTAGEAAGLINTTKAAKTLPGRSLQTADQLVIRAVRGTGATGTTDDHNIDITTILNGPSGYTLGWVNSLGEFFPYGPSSGQSKNITLRPGDGFCPALRRDTTGAVTLANASQSHTQSNDIPPSAALQPPQSSNYSSFVSVNFPSLGLSAAFDAGHEFGDVSPFGNGIQVVLIPPSANLPLAGPWLLVFLMALMAFIAATTIRRKSTAIA